MKNLRLKATLLSFGLAILTVFAVRFGTGNVLLSGNSLLSFQALNSQYQVVVEPLVADESLGVHNLLQASALNPMLDENQDQESLILTVKNLQGQPQIFSLNPHVRLTDDELTGLAKAYERKIPEVEAVERDQDISLEGFPVYDFSLASEPADAEVSLSTQAEEKEVVVAVIDSGIDPTHPIFKDRKILPEVNLVDQDDKDVVGHGTHIAGIIVEESPHAVIAPYKIVGVNGGRLSNVLKAYDQAIADHVDIINSSFGLRNPSHALQEILSKAYLGGITVVAAAGNNNNSEGFYPATYSESVAVASVNHQLKKMPKSNFGDWIDVAADGYMIQSSVPGGGYALKSGTSQATALVSARLAEVLAAWVGPVTQDGLLKELEKDAPKVEGGALAGVPIIQ